jgi:hypothetical protein
MITRAHRSLKVIVFNVNGIVRQSCEVGKQLQGLHVDVALLSETHLKPHERFFILNYHIYWTDCFLSRKGELPLQLEKAFPVTLYKYT